MSALTTSNPLMLPVTWDGKTYYTSNYYHVHYRQNAKEQGHAGKYKRHGDFLDTIRAWPSYQLYLDRKDIIEVAWKSINDCKNEVTEICRYFKPLFQANGWRPILLLNEVAQIELYHHLDDPLSQGLAYHHSKQSAAFTNPYAPQAFLADRRQSREVEYEIELDNGHRVKVKLKLPLEAWAIASAIRDVPLFRDENHNFRLHGAHVHDDVYPWLASAIRDVVRERKATGSAGGKRDDTYAQHLDPQYWYAAVLQMLGMMKLAYSQTLNARATGIIPPHKQRAYYRGILQTNVSVLGINVVLPKSPNDMTLYDDGATEWRPKEQLSLL